MTHWLQLAALAASAVPRMALVVGANQGLAGDEPLQFAESDAEGVAKAFGETGLVPPIGIRTLADPPASDLRAALQAVIAAAPSELFVFYVSSHGDADGLHLNGGMLSWAELTDLLSRVPTRRVLAFVDACRSGAMLTAKGIVRGPPLELSVNALGPRGRALITSSGSSEASYESVWLQGSPFSKLLVSGLRGAADLDRDGRVTLDELYRFLFDHGAAATVAAPGGPQHAHAQLELAGAGDWVITETGARATLRRTRTGLGACYLLDRARERVLAELPESASTLAMPPGRYVIECLSGERLLAATVQLDSEGLALEDAQFHPAERTYALARGPRPPARDILGVEASLRVASGWKLSPEIGLRYRREEQDHAFEIAVAADVRNGPILALGALALPLPLGSRAGSRLGLGLGLHLGGELNPFAEDRQPALLFGPSLRLAIAPRGPLLVVIEPAILTRVDLIGGRTSAAALLTVGIAWDLGAR